MVPENKTPLLVIYISLKVTLNDQHNLLSLKSQGRCPVLESAKYLADSISGSLQSRLLKRGSEEGNARTEPGSQDSGGQFPWRYERLKSPQALACFPRSFCHPVPRPSYCGFLWTASEKLLIAKAEF